MLLSFVTKALTDAQKNASLEEKEETSTSPDSNRGEHTTSSAPERDVTASTTSAMDPAIVENLHKMERTRRLEVIYEAYYDKVYRRAVRYGAGNTAWAEDITQEVFVKLVKSLDTLHEGVDPGPWLMRVTANTCLTKLKRQHFWDHKIPKWIFRDAQTVHVTPERVAGARDSVRKAHALVQELPPKERMAFLMHRVEHLTMEEIGEQLGHSKGYISKLVSRAESKLRAAQWSDDD